MASVDQHGCDLEVAPDLKTPEVYNDQQDPYPYAVELESSTPEDQQDAQHARGSLQSSKSRLNNPKASKKDGTHSKDRSRERRRERFRIVFLVSAAWFAIVVAISAYAGIGWAKVRNEAKRADNAMLNLK